MSLREGGDLWLTCFIAFRFLTRGQNRFALLVTWLSITGLSLGVALLTLVVSVMSGFDQELRQRLLEMVPHVRMLKPQEKDRVSEFLVDDERVSSIHKYFLASGAVRSASGVRPIQIYGIDGEGLSKISPVFEEIAPLKAQEFRTTPNGVLLGAPIAELLGLRVGDLSKLVVVVSDSKGIKPEILNYRLVDTFEVGGDPDYGLALVNLDSQTSSRWERLGETGIEIKLHDPAQALQMSLLLETEFPDAQLHTWTDIYGQLFDAIRLEKSMMFLLLLLVVLIATFNVVSGQLMLVSNKSAGIAVLASMGARATLIQFIFLIQGAAIGFFGVGIGMSLGVFLGLNINLVLDLLHEISGLHLLDGSFFVEVPITIHMEDMLVIGLVTFVACILSSWIPARRAVRLNPKLLLH